MIGMNSTLHTAVVPCRQTERDYVQTTAPSIGAGGVLVIAPVTGRGAQVTRDSQVIVQIGQLVSLEIVLVKAIVGGKSTQRET